MITAAYIRVSTIEQATEGVSLAAQRERILAYCTATGRTLDEVYRECGESAKSMDRPQLQMLLSDVRNGVVGTVIVLKLDRLTRSVRDLADLIDLFRKHNVALVSVSEALDTESASGRMVLNIMATVAQWERETGVERTTMALKHLRRTGRVYGQVPYGYRNENGALVVDDYETRQIAYMKADRDRGESYGHIAQSLNSRSVAAPNGGLWRPSSVYSVLTNRKTQEAM